MTRAQFGYLGYYNKKWGYSPFEGFILGGDGMSGYNTYGNEVIGLRGYENYSLTPYIGSAYAGNVYDKFTVELRYPVIMQPRRPTTGRNTLRPTPAERFIWNGLNCLMSDQL